MNQMRRMVVGCLSAAVALIALAPAAFAENRAGYRAIRTGPPAFTSATSATFGFGPEGSASTNYTCTLDEGAGEACGTTDKTYSDLGLGAHSLRVTGTYVYWDPCLTQGRDEICHGGNVTVHVDETWPWTIDRTGPTATLAAPTALYQLGSTATVAWTGWDTGGAGVKNFTVERKRAPYNGPFGPLPSVTVDAGVLSMTSPLAAGSQDCFRVRATDKVENVGAFSPWRCVALPLDDRALARSSGWTQSSSSVFFNSTATYTRSAGALMGKTGAQLRRIGLVATKCASCGSVTVKVDSATIGTANLYASTTKYKQLITLPAFSFRSGTVRVIANVTGKTVQLDGLALMRD